MRSAAALALIILTAACSNEKPDPAFKQISKEPISVRGWIADIDAGQDSGRFRTVETEAAQRLQNFQSTNIWVDKVPFVSGGVAETGAFVLLDVPPGRAVVGFSAPGIPAASVVIENAPPNADVLIPGLILRRDGVAIADPKALRVRVTSKVETPGPTAMTTTIAGIRVPVTIVPLNAMIDRRDYPTAPAVTPAPVARVK